MNKRIEKLIEQVKDNELLTEATNAVVTGWVRCGIYEVQTLIDDIEQFCKIEGMIASLGIDKKKTNNNVSINIGGSGGNEKPLRNNELVFWISIRQRTDGSKFGPSKHVTDFDDSTIVKAVAHELKTWNFSIDKVITP